MSYNRVSIEQVTCERMRTKLSHEFDTFISRGKKNGLTRVKFVVPLLDVCLGGLYGRCSGFLDVGESLGGLEEG